MVVDLNNFPTLPIKPRSFVTLYCGCEGDDYNFEILHMLVADTFFDEFFIEQKRRTQNRYYVIVYRKRLLLDSGLSRKQSQNEGKEVGKENGYENKGRR